MDKYLWNKYKGIYRVLAHVDQETNDFPRDEKGEIDSSFSDFYIPCNYGIEIRHGVGNVLWVYIPAKRRGINILKSLYNELCRDSDSLISLNELEKQDIGDRYYSHLCHAFEKSGIIFNAEVLDYEAVFAFKNANMDFICKFITPYTRGARISPMSNKNFCKKDYKIPEEDLKQYENVIKNFPRMRMKYKNGKEKEIPDPHLMKTIYEKIDNKIRKKGGKNFCLATDKRKLGLSGKEYIHAKGLWNDFLEEINKACS